MPVPGKIDGQVCKCAKELNRVVAANAMARRIYTAGLAIGLGLTFDMVSTALCRNHVFRSITGAAAHRESLEKSA